MAAAVDLEPVADRQFASVVHYIAAVVRHVAPVVQHAAAVVRYIAAVLGLHDSIHW